MGRLTALRAARWARKKAASEHPYLENLIEEECAKPADGYHYARWIVPSVAAFLAVACFLPLTLTVHPLFGIGIAVLLLVGSVLGGIFHAIARRISPAKILIRKRCHILATRLTGFGSLIGAVAPVSPKVAEILEEAAKAYLMVQPGPGQKPTRGAWAEASKATRLAMDDAMAQMLTLALPETPQAQEVELAKGWAKPLLAEMKASAQSLLEHEASGLSARLEGETALAGLTDARVHLERLQAAAKELESDALNQRG